MQLRFMNIVLCLILLGGLLAACGGTPTVGPGAVETAVAGTLQAAAPAGADQLPTSTATITKTATRAPTDTIPAAPTATETVQPTLLPTYTPVTVAARGSFGPYPNDLCQALRMGFENAIGAPVTVETAAFSDRVSGGTGTACRVHATGTGATYGMAGPFNTLNSLVLSLGWQEDGQYGAGGATGMLDGYRKNGALGLLSVTWKPAADVKCPANQPISACVMTPEQKLFEVTFDVAQPVAYLPLAADQCASWQAALQAASPVPLVMETVSFNDLEWNIGAACQLRGAGTGVEFRNLGDTANALVAVLTSQGWKVVNGADGPTGTIRELASGSQTAVVSVHWQPSADANCPSNQPIESCPLTPGQMLFTLTAAFGQK